jgi:putative endonuclease
MWSAVYIMTNRHHTVLYTGVTSDLDKRVIEHRNGVYPNSFTRRYNADILVYYEVLPDIRAAIAREKQIKGWKRDKKVRLIESMNPGWNDLAEGFEIGADRRPIPPS